jgi:hypothetical protein
MYITDKDMQDLEGGLQDLTKQQANKKAKEENLRKIREMDKMLKYGRTKPKSFNEIYAEVQAKQPSDADLRNAAMRRLQEIEREKEDQEREEEQLWLANKRRSSDYKWRHKTGRRFSDDTTNTLDEHVNGLHETADEMKSLSREMKKHSRDLAQHANDLTELYRSEGQGPAYAMDV